MFEAQRPISNGLPQIGGEGLGEGGGEGGRGVVELTVPHTVDMTDWSP